MSAEQLRPGGRMLFFPGSFAWDNARHVVAACARSGAIEQVGTYRSLLVFRRTAAAKNRDDASFALQP